MALQPNGAAVAADSVVAPVPSSLALPHWLSPTFDVDESVATAVLSHVKSTRDRLALACSSRVWRQAAASEGSWGTCDLVIDGNLSVKITDARFERLLRYCGDVRNLQICGPMPSFGGKCLYKAALATKFQNLETVKFKNCPYVSGLTVACFLRSIGVRDRPKKNRLRCLHLEECNIDPNDLGHFHECLSVDPCKSFHKNNDADDKEISFNLWRCSECMEIIENVEVAMCVVCDDTFCADSCGDDHGYTFCEFCYGFVCHGECENQVTSYLCHGCENASACESCALGGNLTQCLGSLEKPGCSEWFCDGCMEEFVLCDACDCAWCEDCWDALPKTISCDECGKCVCGACVEKNFVVCDACDCAWCEDCWTALPKTSSCAKCHKHACKMCVGNSKFNHEQRRCGSCRLAWCDACDVMAYMKLGEFGGCTTIGVILCCTACAKDHPKLQIISGE